MYSVGERTSELLSKIVAADHQPAITLVKPRFDVWHKFLSTVRHSVHARGVIWRGSTVALPRLAICMGGGRPKKPNISSTPVIKLSQFVQYFYY